MDYKEKYEKLVEAVKVLQEENPSDEGIRNWVNDNVPELCESGDEKIRKVLIDYFKNYKTQEEIGIKTFFGIQTDDIIAWLEKQGEQKPIWHNEDEEPQRGSLILLIMQSGTPIVAKIIEPNHTFNHGEKWAYIDDLLEKQGEQKPAWSEEDDSMFQSCIGAVATNDYYKGEEKEQIYDWLKSLRQRLK